MNKKTNCGWITAILGIVTIFLTGCFFSMGFLLWNNLKSSPVLHIGLMGDSTIDEYRGTANRGGDFASVT